MSNLIYIGEQRPINLDLVEEIYICGSYIDFKCAPKTRTWNFDSEQQAKIVYTAILRSRCKNIGKTELTAEEIQELEDDL